MSTVEMLSRLTIDEEKASAKCPFDFSPPEGGASQSTFTPHPLSPRQRQLIKASWQKVAKVTGESATVWIVG